MDCFQPKTHQYAFSNQNALVWVGCKAVALFIWSQVPQTTLPPSYAGQGNDSLFFFLQNLEGRCGVGEGGGEICLGPGVMITVESGTTFLHIDTLARLTETILGMANDRGKLKEREVFLHLIMN